MSRRSSLNRLTNINLSNAEVKKLIPALRIAIRPRQLKLTHSEGREARMKDYGKVITSLIKDERVESNFISLSETRNYAERLIAEAIKHGDKHQPTMELADFWINDKQAIHKLFKVLVPRFQNTSFSYTKMYKAPTVYPGHPHPRAVLELRNNPLVPVLPRPVPTRNWINNVLLEEARKEFELKKKKAKEQAALSQESKFNDEEID